MMLMAQVQIQRKLNEWPWEQVGNKMLAMLDMCQIGI